MAKEFRDVLTTKRAIEKEYDPENEYGIPKAKTIVTPGTLKKGLRGGGVTVAIVHPGYIFIFR